MCPAARSSSANARNPGVCPCAWWKRSTSATTGGGYTNRLRRPAAPARPTHDDLRPAAGEGDLPEPAERGEGAAAADRSVDWPSVAGESLREQVADPPGQPPRPAGGHLDRPQTAVVLGGVRPEQAPAVLRPGGRVVAGSGTSEADLLRAVAPHQPDVSVDEAS